MALTAVVTDDEGQSRTTDGPPEGAGPTDATTPITHPGSDEPDLLPKDLIFGLLRNQRRRGVLRYLAENEPEATLSDIAEHIASIENDKPVAGLTSHERKRVYVSLYQVHLPKLDDANVIDYNQPRGIIELNAEADQLLTYLDVCGSSAGSDRAASWWRRLVPAPLLALWRNTASGTLIELVRRR